MNIPTSELQEFFEEYGSLAFPGQRVLRADHFCRQDAQKCLSVFMTEQEGKQLLTDAASHVLCEYDRITPLFAASAVKVSLAVQDLLEQLSGLRSQVPREDYENARVTVQTLGLPSHPFTPAYLVLQKGLLGVLDPDGTVIVPPEYTQVQPFALTHPGDASLFLCRRSGHQLNSMDVYDLRGNCIFRQISNLLPREETLLTPAVSGAPLRKVKSLWVIRQTVEHPFPEDPDFQLIREEPRRYTLRELRRPGSDGIRLGAMEDRPVWHHCPAEDTPPRDALLPLATVIGEAIGCSAQEVLARLPDYRAFRQERIPLSVRLANVTADTPLDQLGLSIRAYHCLVQNGLETAGDLLVLSEEAIPRLHRSTDEITREIITFRNTLAKTKKHP